MTTPRVVTSASVLVVEDEPRLRELLQRALGQWGFAVSIARSGEEAIRVAAVTPPQIVVLDLNLPGMDGLSCLEKLRERAESLQAVVLTGFGSLEAARTAVHLDVVEFLTKPCHLGELERAMDRALRRLVPPSPKHLPEAAESPVAPEAGQTLEQLERQHILSVLAQHEGNRTAAATALGISRRTLYYKLEQYERDGFRIP